MHEGSNTALACPHGATLIDVPSIKSFLANVRFTTPPSWGPQYLPDRQRTPLINWECTVNELYTRTDAWEYSIL